MDDFEALARDVVERWRRRREAAAGEPAAGCPPGVGVVLWAAISAILPGHPEHGDCLEASPVRFVGTPPQAQAVPGPTVVCHPPPNHVVSDYQVGELVKVFLAAGANIAEKVV